MKFLEVPRQYRKPLRSLQGAIAIATGLITIVGAGYSVYRFMNPWSAKGVIEAVIQDGESGGPLAGAKVEIRSATKAVIATVDADQNGRVNYVLKEGQYGLRIVRDGYWEATRQFQITPGQKVELPIKMISLVPVKGIQDTFKKIIGK